jgi:hypothetical protein
MVRRPLKTDGYEQMVTKLVNLDPRTGKLTTYLVTLNADVRESQLSGGSWPRARIRLEANS